jgi:hypothetical protein
MLRGYFYKGGLPRVGVRKMSYIRTVLYGCVTAVIRGWKSTLGGDSTIDQDKGKHREALRSPACEDSWRSPKTAGLIDLQYEERLKARQEKKGQDDQNASCQETGEAKDLSAPISQREAT